MSPGIQSSPVPKFFTNTASPSSKLRYLVPLSWYSSCNSCFLLISVAEVGKEQVQPGSEFLPQSNSARDNPVVE